MRDGSETRLGFLGLSALLLAMLGGVLASAQERGGRLVIAGGALQADNAAVFEAFLDSLPDPEASIAIVPAASGSPASSAERIADAFADYGVSRERLVLVRLAVRDDEDTPDVDEGRWAENAANPEEVAKTEAAGGVWMTGGDQARLTAILLGEGGAQTPMLAALRALLDRGGVVGGTSAGAAVMGPIMIAQGESMTALLEPHATADTPDRDIAPDTLVLSRGLGFLPGFVTDQHFEQRARLGRLAQAVSLSAEAGFAGLGVDENTAALVDLGAGEITALGAGAVTLLAHERSEPQRFNLSVLSGGDRWDMAENTLTPADYKAATVRDEYYDRPPASGGGMATPSPELGTLLGGQLLDNAGGERLERVSFRGDGRGVRYSFRQTRQSRGYWGYDPAGASRYAIAHIRFEITPVVVDVRAAPEEVAP